MTSVQQTMLTAPQLGQVGARYFCIDGSMQMGEDTHMQRKDR